MALPSSWSRFHPGDTFTADAITERFRGLETWVNGNVQQTDLKETPWVDSRHIFKPEFYGSPAPRIEAVSGDTHYRERPYNMESRYYRHEQGGWYKMDKKNEDGTYSVRFDPRIDLQDASVKDPKGLFTPVEGLATSIHLPVRSLVTVTASWYAHESGGDSGESKQKNKNHALDDRCALFRLFHQSPDSSDTDITQVGSTSRILYVRSDSGYNFRRQNFSTTFTREFGAGNHHIWIGILYFLKDISGDGYLQLGSDGRGHRWKHVYVDARNFVVSTAAIYRDRSD